MKSKSKVTETIYKNSTDTSDGLLIKFENIEKVIAELEALSICSSSLQLNAFFEKGDKVSYVDSIAATVIEDLKDGDVEIRCDDGEICIVESIWLKRQ